MTGPEMQAIREKLGLPRKDFGLLLGYGGDLQQVYKTVQRYEGGKRAIPPTIARLTHLLGVWYDVTGEIKVWPDSIDIYGPIQEENDECDS